VDPPKLDAGSFEFYEGIRILIPGAALVAVYAAVVATFRLTAPTVGQNALADIAAAIVGGLLIYFIDAPAKAASFTVDLPDRQLDELKIRRPPGVSRLNLYFVALDEIVPGPIRARALYMGVMYRIGFELIYLAFLSSAAVFAIVVLGVSSPARDSHQTYVVFAAGIGLLISLIPWCVYAAYQRALRRLRRHASTEPKGGEPAGPERRAAAKAVWTELRDGIPPLDRLLLIGAAVCIAAFCVCQAHAPVLYAIAAGLSGSLWVIRYFRGTRKISPAGRWLRLERLTSYFKAEGPAKSRAPLKQSAAATYYCLAALMPCIAEMTVRVDRSPLSPGVAAAWLAVSVIGGALVVARGHERRLDGSYATQRAWFMLNAEKVRQHYDRPFP
jgi:hypothetical protein